MVGIPKGKVSSVPSFHMPFDGNLDLEYFLLMVV
jgi:hypothetical protein